VVHLPVETHHPQYSMVLKTGLAMQNTDICSYLAQSEQDVAVLQSTKLKVTGAKRAVLLYLTVNSVDEALDADTEQTISFELLMTPYAVCPLLSEHETS
jgi:hypothetical protein